MKLLVVLLTLLVATATSASPLKFSGAVGPYKVELELERSDDGLIGRYRYVTETTWITLAGETFGTDALRLEENVSGSVTGHFFLENRNQRLEGFWVNETSDFEVHLTPVIGVADDVFAPELKPAVSDALTGQYSVGSYWVNDYFAPRYEIGFNGGKVNVVEISPNQILVGFSFIVGPTYHIASFRGHAIRTEEGTYVHNAVLPYGSTPCRLEFRFNGTQLSINDDGNGSSCQFGARAHATFDLQKTSDTAEFSARW